MLPTSETLPRNRRGFAYRKRLIDSAGIAEPRFRVRTVSVAFPVSNDGSRPVPPSSARSAPIAPARSRCSSGSDPTRRSTKLPNDIKMLRIGLRLRTAPHTYGASYDAGWSSPVARQAHNLKVVSSNLAPATKNRRNSNGLRRFPFWGSRCIAARIRTVSVNDLATGGFGWRIRPWAGSLWRGGLRPAGITEPDGLLRDKVTHGIKEPPATRRPVRPVD